MVVGFEIRIRVCLTKYELQSGNTSRQISVGRQPCCKSHPPRSRVETEREGPPLNLVPTTLPPARSLAHSDPGDPIFFLHSPPPPPRHEFAHDQWLLIGKMHFCCIVDVQLNVSISRSVEKLSSMELSTLWSATDLSGRNKYSSNRRSVVSWRESQGQIGSQKLSLYPIRSYQIHKWDWCLKSYLRP